MKVLSIFSGIGGFDLAAEWTGFEVVGQVEIEPFCIKVLEKYWPSVKRIADVKNVKGNEFGPVDLLCGGPPCQPASVAGLRKGTEDDRWLWGETIRLVKAIKPRWCLLENPTGILSLQGGVPFEHLLLDLEAQGYTVQAFVLPAASVNAPHRRDRVWIVAHANNTKTSRQRKHGWKIPTLTKSEGFDSRSSINWWSTEPDVGRVAHGVSSRVDRLKSLGNAIVPQVAEQIFRAIKMIEQS